MTKTNLICEKLYEKKEISFLDFKYLYELEDFSELNKFAREISLENFSNEIYIRGLIEISTFCKNDCFYCGLRNSNKNMNRIRMQKEEILEAVNTGYSLGIRTIVLQGGEDPYFTIDVLEDIIRDIKNNFSDAALTLSIGERSLEDYRRLRECGANRFLLRHETNSNNHYKKLHPKNMSFENRINCLYNLKKLGFQTGCGMMIGSPYQTIENIYRDLQLILDLKPHMVGLGPFIPHRDTPFKDFPAGKLEDVLKILSIVRITDEKLLLPATTALGSIDKTGREKGILAGANVLMPNIGLEKLRRNYKLYDGKIGTELENQDDFKSLSSKVEKIGYKLSLKRGDY